MAMTPDQEAEAKRLEEERAVAKEAERNIIDPNGALGNWKPDTHLCHWNGVKYTLTRPWRVRKLKLNGQGLGGQISSSLGNLTFIESLDLSDNSFHGPIPLLNRLQHLKILYLGGNLLQGAIAEALTNCSSLENHLTGVIPPNVGFLINLVGLDLQRNNLTGIIPPLLGNITTLQFVILGENKLNGIIPDNIWHMKNIVWLNLGNELPSNIGPTKSQNSVLGREYVRRPHFRPGTLLESFRGFTLYSLREFFHALVNCSLLKELSLANNNLQGPIPNSIANLTTNIAYLLMDGNQLSGIVPPSIGKFNGLTELRLDFNNLSGTIIEWIGKLKNLQYLNLQSNNFIGIIPPSISNLTQLVVFSIAENKFTSFVPPSLGKLQHILKLNLSYNNFQGSISVELGNLGRIPETLGQLQQIYTIQLEQNILTGNIPYTFSNLVTLSMLNISHNDLSGPIPVFIAYLGSLTTLDLSYNGFQGEIPTAGIFGNATSLSLYGNPGLCGGVINLHMPSCHAFYIRGIGVIYLVKLLIPVLGFMSLIVFILIIIHGKTTMSPIMSIWIMIHGKTTSRRPYLLFSFGRQFPKVSYKHLAKATGNFSVSNLIGRGSYGSVYKGKLTQARIQVAIKVFDLEMRNAEETFLSECDMLRKTRHRNLLSILTACSTIDNTGNDFKALIYEFMHNGNLDTWLHHRRADLATKYLGLVQRINIAVGIADALAYLHHDCESHIVHCDLKPTNILLDDDMDAHLGDFGIATLVLDSRSKAVGHSGLHNYAHRVHASTCGDVYSFGIVLLEMLIGKRTTDAMFEDELTIVSFVERNFPDQMLHIIDAHLREECKGIVQGVAETENEVYLCVLSLAQVALSCTRRSPRERMNMREVAINLHSIRRSYVQNIKQEQVL
ncbi:hypothetical protein EJB05_20790, partial [Eragrostis curvula]